MSTTTIDPISPELLNHVTNCMVTTDPAGNFELTVFVRNGVTVVYMPQDNTGPLINEMNFATYDAPVSAAPDEFFTMKIGVLAIDWAHPNPPRDFIVNFYEFDSSTPSVSATNYLIQDRNAQRVTPKSKKITYTHSAGERGGGEREFSGVIPGHHHPGRRKPISARVNTGGPAEPRPIISKSKNQNYNKPKGK